MPFKNSILIVAFNYSAHLHHIPFFIEYYKPHFKKIIFYSDLPCNNDISHVVHYLPIASGYYLHSIFNHFYTLYKEELEVCDGLFYTMDDNILNTRLLSQLPSNKILYEYQVPVPIDEHANDWWWGKAPGKAAIRNMLQDSAAADLIIPLFSGGFSDYFFIPKQYLTERVFRQFEMCAKHNVFLEIAIPSIIHTLETNKDMYTHVSVTHILSQHKKRTTSVSAIALWGNDRLLVRNKEWLQSQYKNNLFVHPIKLGENEQYKNWIREATRNQKCIVITTINPPTSQVLAYADNPEWDLIVVADTKTDVINWNNVPCIFLTMEKQQELAPDLFRHIPERSYTRKMFGYLYAYKHGYTTIYDTDDDNVFKGGLVCPSMTTVQQTITSTGFNNIYNLFTDKYIWPRGIPPGHPSINEYPVITGQESMPCAVVQGLVDNDPDVDAYYRINVSDKPFIFEKTHGDVALGRFAVCPFNTQNTFWLDRAEWYHMYLPITVTFRYTDILRGVISLYRLWAANKTLLFTGATAVQERNVHDLQKDLEQEQPMYDTITQVIGLLTSHADASLMDVYRVLATHGIVSAAELDCLRVWLSYFH